MGLMPDAKLNKDEVNYRLHEKCMTCNYYFYPTSCQIVEGNISQDAVCKRWEVKPKTEPMDGEGYKAEYDKAQQ
jgi:hypothetical protein